MKLLRISSPSYWVPDRGLEAIANWTTSRQAAVFRIGDQGTNAPVAEVLYMPPDYVIVRHAHSCHRMEFVLQGSMYIDGQVLAAGDAMYASPGDFYGPKVAGPDGCVALEIFAQEDGITGPFTYLQPDGSTIDVNLSAGEASSRPSDPDELRALREEAASAFRLHCHDAPNRPYLSDTTPASGASS